MGNELYDRIMEVNGVLNGVTLSKVDFNKALSGASERKPKRKMTDKQFLRSAIPMLNDMVRDLGNLQDRLRDCGKSDDEALKGYIHDRIIGTCEIGFDLLCEILEEVKCGDEE